MLLSGAIHTATPIDITYRCPRDTQVGRVENPRGVRVGGLSPTIHLPVVSRGYPMAIREMPYWQPAEVATVAPRVGYWARHSRLRWLAGRVCPMIAVPSGRHRGG